MYILCILVNIPTRHTYYPHIPTCMYPLNIPYIPYIYSHHPLYRDPSHAKSWCTLSLYELPNTITTDSTDSTDMTNDTSAPSTPTNTHSTYNVSRSKNPTVLDSYASLVRVEYIAGLLKKEVYIWVIGICVCIYMGDCICVCEYICIYIYIVDYS